jgi:hydroxymethylbilane synthase
MERTEIRVGTRGSALARTQTGWVVDQFRARGHEVSVELVSTRGDVVTDVPIAGIRGGDGVFVRELERALLDGRIDAAVHSFKDLPTAVTPGLELACVPLRASPFDAFVGRAAPTIDQLPPRAVVGTSSVRRVMQLRARRPDLEVRSVRGNVDTRLRQLDEGACDGLILAAAGLGRLGLEQRITEVLRPDAFWPAVAQGALVVQIRSGDPRMAAVVSAIDDPSSHAAVRAERACLAALAGGCLAPVGAWARFEGDLLHLGACVLGPNGAEIATIEARAVANAAETPEKLGRRVAEDLRRLGADDLLALGREAEGRLRQG